MELRDLRSFVEVARRGSFSAAAAALGYTQSAVSQHVAALEADLGRTLLGRRPVRPTPAGERLLEHATRVLLRLDVARSELLALGDVPAEVRVGATPLAAPRLVAAVFRDLRAATPSLRLTLRALDAGALVAEVAAGRVALGLVDGVAAPNDPLALADAGLLAATLLAQEPLVVALPARHPLASHPALDLETVADAPWIDAPALASGVDGLAPAATLRYEGADVATLLALVASGHGLALLPGPALAGAAGVRGVPLRTPPLVHRTELLALRPLAGAAARVAEAFRARAST